MKTTILRLCLIHAIVVGVTAAVAAAESTTQPTTRSASRTKKLIEFGWDEPDTAFMRKHIDEMKRSPFDGCVFHVRYAKPKGKTGTFTWDCWGKQAFAEADFAQTVEDLKTTDFGRFRHNFLRFNTTPADLDWFDDFAAIVNNARLAAWLARQGGCDGVLFDIEQYNAPLFHYAKQRDAAKRSWEDYAAQARRRGREVMLAFQEGYPNLTVLMTFGYVLPWEESDSLARPLSQCSYGLLAPFMDGLVEAAEGTARIVDGCESAYRYTREEQFPKNRRMILERLLPIVADHEKYRRVVSCSFGLWMDYDWRNKGWNVEDPTKNPRPPEAFSKLVGKALETADEYVWIYTETPRWWSDQGKPIKLPEAYDRALRDARRHGTSRPAP